MINITNLNLDKFEHIPQLLKKFIIKSINDKDDNKLVQVLEKNSEKTLNAIAKMFEMAEKFTNLSCNELFTKTGFNISDKNSGRVDSSFAEIRAINFLGINNFYNIEIVHNKKKKYSDIIAFRNNQKICFEVLCITNEGKSKWTEKDLIDFIKFRLNKKGKLEQLLNTKKDFQCDFMNLIIVIVDYAGVALNNRNDYLKILEQIDESSKMEELTYSIVTGKIDYFTGLENDCIYPEKF